MPPTLEDIVRTYRPSNPSVPQLQQWVEDCQPDFRVRLTIGPTGERLAFGSFIWRGNPPGRQAPEPHHFRGSGDFAAEEVIIGAARKLRSLMGVPVAGSDRRPELEREIIAARAAGRHKEADDLEAELLAARAGGDK